MCHMILLTRGITYKYINTFKQQQTTGLIDTEIGLVVARSGGLEKWAEWVKGVKNKTKHHLGLDLFDSANPKAIFRRIQQTLKDV